MAFLGGVRSTNKTDGEISANICCSIIVHTAYTCTARAMRDYFIHSSSRVSFTLFIIRTLFRPLESDLASPPPSPQGQGQGTSLGSWDLGTSGPRET